MKKLILITLIAGALTGCASTASQIMVEVGQRMEQHAATMGTTSGQSSTAFKQQSTNQRVLCQTMDGTTFVQHGSQCPSGTIFVRWVI